MSKFTSLSVRELPFSWLTAKRVYNIACLESSNPREALISWAQIIQQCSSRSLTLETDRFPELQAWHKLLRIEVNWVDMLQGEDSGAEARGKKLMKFSMFPLARQSVASFEIMEKMSQPDNLIGPCYLIKLVRIARLRVTFKIRPLLENDSPLSDYQ
jgi:hypothetical protein